MSAVATAEHLWLAVAVSGVALGLRGGLPLVGAAAPFAIGAVTTALLDGVVPLPVAACGGVLAAALAGGLMGVLLARADLIGRCIAGLALIYLVEQVLLSFPLGAGGATDVAVQGRLVSPSLGLSWRLTPSVLLAGAALTATGVAVLLRRFGLAQRELDLVRTSPATAAAVGIRPSATTVVLATVCGGVLGLAGAGYLVCAGAAGPTDVGVQLSLQLLAAGLLARVLTPSAWGAFPAVAALWALQQLVPDRVTIGLALLAAAALGPGRLWRSADQVGASQSRGGGLWRSADPPVPGQSLRVEGLSVSYGSRTALDDVSLQLRPGEVHALVGANGSGKTTLVRAVCGAVPSQGIVLLDGGALTGSEPTRVRAGVARTLQLEGVRIDLRLAARCRDRRGTLLRLALGGPDVATWPSAGGPPQLRQAVATGARVLLLDELGGGDETEAAIRALAAQGCTVLIVEHDLAVVRRLASTTTVLDLGRVIASGPTAEVLDAAEIRAAFSGVEA